jgi:hypothetical protein
MGIEHLLCNKYYTNLLQFSVGFFIGVSFGPISKGILWLIVWIIIYEIILLWGTRKLKEKYRTDARFLINIGSLIGWVVSRKLFIDKIL